MEREPNITLNDLDEIERSKYLPLTIILVITMVVGIIGNSLVIIIYKNKFRRASARCYILSLAMADLSVCVFGIPYHVLDLTLILTYSYTNVCKVLSFCIGACTLSSVFILLVVGLDRYFKVCRPLKRQIKDFGDRKACLLAVCAAVVISVPNGIIYGQSSVEIEANNLTGVECFIDDGYHGSELAVGYLGLNMLLFIISVVFLVIIYGFICRKIYRHDNTSGAITLKNNTRKVCLCCIVENTEDDEVESNKELKDISVKQNDLEHVVKTINKNEEETKSLETNVKKSKDKADRKLTVRTSCAIIRHSKQGSEEKNTRKITLMMMTITIVFIISYLPFIIISILDSVDETFWTRFGDSESLLLDLLLRLYLTNNVANPIIYSFWDHRFRYETEQLLKNLIYYRKKDTNNDRINYKSTVHHATYALTKCTETMTNNAKGANCDRYK